jgi:uncharacterized protein (DUF1810 family)
MRMHEVDQREDPHELSRFVAAQAGVFDRALQELCGGRKRSHWMWFIFPQLEGLGTSSMAAEYAIRSLDEARAYLQHPLLGPRLRECCQVLLSIEGKTALEIMGSPDYLKLRSCMTLFSLVAEPHSVFEKVIAKYYESEPDRRTLELLGRVNLTDI